MKFYLSPYDRRMVLKIVALYALVGALWIYLSDFVLGFLVRDPDIMTRLATYKGLFFITVTAALLYYLIGRYVSRLNAQNQKLKENEERFQAIVRTSSDGFTINDAKGRFVDCNEVYCRILGYSADEVRGMQITDVEAREGGEEFTRHFEKVIRQGSDRFETRHRRKDGSLIDVEVSVTYLPRYQSFFSFVRDISLRKEEQRLLSDQRARLHALLQTIPALIWLKDPEGVYLACNARFEAFFGARESEIIGKTDYDFVSKEMADFFREHDQRAISADRPSVNDEVVTFASDGHQELLETIKTPMRDEMGNLVGVLGIARDITDLKRAEADLRSSEERYRNLFDQNPAPMLIYEKGGLKLLAANEAFLYEYGYDAEEILSLHLPDLYPGQEKTRIVEVVSTLTGHVNVGEWHHCRKDGSLLTIVATSHDITYQGQEARIAVITDITERKLLEDQLRQSQKMEAIGQLAGGVAHDFNNILQVILGYATLLERTAQPVQKEPLHEIITASERAAELTNGLLSYSRKQVFRIAPTDLGLLVEQVEKFLRRIVGEDISLCVEPATEPLVCALDPAHLQQVFVNLATNARDAMGLGGKLTISLKRVEIDREFATAHGFNAIGSFALVSVSDCGHGVPVEYQERIFEPFFTTKGEGKGTGLGLSIVYGIIRQHNGFITCSSREGEGTTFQIFLPLTGQAPVAEPSSRVEAHPGPNRKEATILIAEDDRAVREVTRDILALSGYVVLEAENGRKAVETYLKNRDRIDLVILDALMPELNGAETLVQLRGITPGLKALFLSGYAREIIGGKMLLPDDVEFIGKPVFPPHLLISVQNILAAPG